MESRTEVASCKRTSQEVRCQWLTSRRTKWPFKGFLRAGGDEKEEQRKKATITTSYLAALGMAEVWGEGMYEELIAIITKNNLGMEHVTIGFVFELSHLVYVKPMFSRVAAPADKLTIQQFCHIVMFMADRWGVEAITKQVMRSVWCPKELAKLKSEVEQGKLWPGLKRLKVNKDKEMEMEVGESVVQNTEELEMSERGGGVKGEEAGGSKGERAWGGEGGAGGVEGGAGGGDGGDDEQMVSDEEISLVKCDGFLAAAGLTGRTVAEVAVLLEEWAGGLDMITNGLVVELQVKFRGAAVHNALTAAIARQLGIHQVYVERELVNRFRKYYIYTVELVRKEAVALEAPWHYLELLRRGGKLSRDHIFEAPSRFEEFVMRLQWMVVRGPRRCGKCGELGDLAACDGCLSVWYCSHQCQHQAWDAGHQDVCSTLRQAVYGDAVLPVPTEGVEKSLYQSRNRYSGLYAATKEELEESKAVVVELQKNHGKDEENNVKLAQKLKKTSKSLKIATKSKAGLVSGVARMRRCEKKNEVKTREKQMETEVKLLKTDTVVRMEPAPVAQFPHLHLLTGQELIVSERTAVASAKSAQLYLRVSTTSSMATEVGRFTKQVRAKQVVEVLHLLSHGTATVSPEVAALAARQVVTEVARLEPHLVEEVVRAKPRLLKSMMTLSTEDLCMFVNTTNMTMSAMRKGVRILKNRLGVGIMGSEARLRRYQANLTELVSSDKLDSTYLLLYKTASSKHPTPQASVKVKDLPALVCRLVSKVTPFFPVIYQLFYIVLQNMKTFENQAKKTLCLLVTLLL